MVHWPPFVFSDASPGQLRIFFIKQGGRSKINTLSHFKDISRLGRVGVKCNYFFTFFSISSHTFFFGGGDATIISPKIHSFNGF